MECLRQRNRVWVLQVCYSFMSGMPLAQGWSLYYERLHKNGLPTYNGLRTQTIPVVLPQPILVSFVIEVSPERGAFPYGADQIVQS
jgi:hypothetical protein